MKSKKHILIIAPLTPPYTGNALPVKYIFDKYSNSDHVGLINLSKGSFKAGLNSPKRVLQIIKIIFKVFTSQRKKDLIYLTVAESTLGNLRDILIYLVTFFNNNKIIIHLLGGNSMKKILSDKKSTWFWINKFFLNRLGAVIVEGGFQSEFYQNVISLEKIHIIPNFAETFLFSDEVSINKKYSKYLPVRMLFLSNLIYGKGFKELLDAYINLNENIQANLILDFAGGFETDEEKNEFINKIKPYKQIKYWGHVGREIKLKLFKNAHVFCLPTYYPFEGQPFVIIEAYASGCAVITTNHSGIGFIFKDKVNGIEVQKKSVDDLKLILSNIVDLKDVMLNYAIYNNKIAKEIYTKDVYLFKVEQVFNHILI